MGRRSSNRVTIVQVAKAAGVSTQTVSRVINDYPGVLPETRERVQSAIERLHYRPNVIARSLSQLRTRTIGVVTAGLDFFGPSRTLVAIEQRAVEAGFSLHLHLLHRPESNNVQSLIDDFLSRQVDGLIWATQEIGSNLEWLDREPPPIPMVFLESRPRPKVRGVNIDSRRGSLLAVRHLLDRGYRKIGIITGPLAWWSARERKQGWRDALGEAGIEPEDRWLVEGDWLSGSGAAGLERLIGSFPEMEAVFVCNDQMALGALQTSRRTGRRVPEDVAVVGYDDIPEAEFFWPPLTTVRQDLMKLGGTVVDLLSELIAARWEGKAVESPSETVWLKPELVVRESSGARRDDPPPPPEK
jgi:LacI family transcriptional regulator